MEVGGKKFVKPQKTKFKYEAEPDNLKHKPKPKKRDKNAFRLLRQERDYSL